MKKIELTPKEQYAVWSYCAEAFQRRAQSVGYKEKSKEYQKMQLEFFIGAITAIDCLLDAQTTRQTCAPAVVIFAGVRDDIITPDHFKLKPEEEEK